MLVLFFPSQSSETVKENLYHPIPVDRTIFYVVVQVCLGFVHIICPTELLPETYTEVKALPLRFTTHMAQATLLDHFRYYVYKLNHIFTVQV